MKYAPSYQQVKSVELLGSEAKVVWEMTPAGLQISPPADLGSSTIAWSFKIETDRQQYVPNAIQGYASLPRFGHRVRRLSGAD